jgi:hypothetical protein
MSFFITSTGPYFCHVRPSYEWAMSNLDRSMNISLWLWVAHSSFTEGSHTTKNTASVLEQVFWLQIQNRFCQLKSSVIEKTSATATRVSVCLDSKANCKNKSLLSNIQNDSRQKCSCIVFSKENVALLLIFLCN